MIVQFSTGGRSGKGDERGGMLPLRPDMASLATGSCNFPNIIYENPPALIRELAGAMRRYGVKPEIEVFDLSMLYQAVNLVDEGLIEAPLHVQFVFGIKNCMPALRQVLEFEVAELARLMPEATWTAAGIGRHQLEVNRWSLELGAIAAPGSKTTCAGTGTGWLRPTPNSSAGSLPCAPSTAAARQPLRKPANSSASPRRYRAERRS
jgi:3-keto-5-aminohexanoate cleavage enzyme